MKRYAALEFPEYVNWAPEAEAMNEFRDQIAQKAKQASIKMLSMDDHLELYRGLLRARLHDIQLKRWVRQGVITKAWLGTGEEAVTVGTCRALGADDVAKQGGGAIGRGNHHIDEAVVVKICERDSTGGAPDL